MGHWSLFWYRIDLLYPCICIVSGAVHTNLSALGKNICSFRTEYTVAGWSHGALYFGIIIVSYVILLLVEIVITNPDAE